MGRGISKKPQGLDLPILGRKRRHWTKESINMGQGGGLSWQARQGNGSVENLIVQQTLHGRK